jgi:hypothetical protein
MRSPAIICPHQEPTERRNAFRCTIGMYGGHPYLGNCLQCIKSGANTPAHAAELAARAARAHPANRPRLSGCCDRADQA